MTGQLFPKPHLFTDERDALPSELSARLSSPESSSRLYSHFSTWHSGKRGVVPSPTTSAQNDAALATSNRKLSPGERNDSLFRSCRNRQRRASGAPGRPQREYQSCGNDRQHRTAIEARRPGAEPFVQQRGETTADDRGD